MSLTAKENFRMGFLMRCAEEGCTAEDIRTRVKLAHVLRSLGQDEQFVKEAADPVTATTNKALGGLGWLAGSALSSPFTAAMYGVGGAGVLGAAGGYGLAKLQDQEVDPEDAKHQELVAAYRAQAERIRRKTKNLSHRQFKPEAPKLFDGDNDGF